MFPCSFRQFNFLLLLFFLFFSFFFPFFLRLTMLLDAPLYYFLPSFAVFYFYISLFHTPLSFFRAGGVGAFGLLTGQSLLCEELSVHFICDAQLLHPSVLVPKRGQGSIALARQDLFLHVLPCFLEKAIAELRKASCLRLLGPRSFSNLPGAVSFLLFFLGIGMALW